MSSEHTSTDAGAAFKPPFLTFVLIAINVLIYVLIQSQGGPTYENLIKYGAKENGLIAEGEIGRLFFPMFLHASPAHILFNMFALYQFGRIFEVLTSAQNLFVTYVLGGLLGNAVSFTFSKNLSVGASSSLFALLFALYVLERYQQKITVETTGIKTKTSLGPVIVINAIITFIIPNIDWASHLGGAVAGVLIGLGLIMKHKANVRLMSMVKYWRVDPATLQLKFFQREGFYLGTIALLVLASLLRIPQIAFADRVFGLGVLDASQSKLVAHAETELPSYRTSFNDVNSPAYPDTMLKQALAQHLDGRFEVSAALYSALLRMNEFGLGTPEFASKSTQALMEQALEQARGRQPIDTTLVHALGEDNSNFAADPGFCLKAADYVRGLGFFSVSGLLYKCAFYVQFGNKDHARAAIADMWLESRRCEEQPIPVSDDSGGEAFLSERIRRRNCFQEIDLFRSELLESQRLGLLSATGLVQQPAGAPSSEQGL